MRFFLILSMLVITSCTYDELLVGCMDSLALNYDPYAQVDDGSCIFSDCEVSSPSFTDCVEPIFIEHCWVCHFPSNPNGILSLSNYEEIRNQVLNGNVIESIKREVGFMPKNGERLTVEEILIIENWKENGAPNN